MYSQYAISYSDASFSGWLYHNNSISIGDKVEPHYNLLLTKPEIGATPQESIFLQVAYGKDNTGGLRIVDPTDGFLVGINKDTAIINQQENADLIFKTDATNRAVIKNNGYVGIGIMNPAHILHVHGSGTTGGGTTGGGGLSTATFTSRGSGTENKSLPIGHITPMSYAAIQLTNNATGTSATDGLMFEVKNNNATINLQEKGSITFRNANDVSMYISKEHNVGIGLTNPEAKLDVKGKVIIRNELKSLELLNGSSRFSFVVPHPYQAQTEGFQGLGIYDEMHHTYRLVITNDGKIGIGTTNTSGYDLAIKGTVVAQDVTVKEYYNWPDFVFSNEHNILPIPKLENYIKRNKHLPGIPSAKEVKENGLKLGEMNKLLLQKVEELTLYIIQQQKEIEKLKKEVENSRK